ncbi:hypothetical protein [Corallococcus sp. EGB]|uniref:hypothetical protein n=1 Tax=Corallococcus sp. EGB TaxID=1521117 RepID=UPI001CC1C09C|nr:hypothetical protein [Corallococcus sp. EGB]
MCGACGESGALEHCPTCRERFGDTFPLRREKWSVGKLWDVCSVAFQREWVMLSVATLISLGVSFGAQMLVNLATTIGGSLDSVVLTAVLAVVGLVAQQLVQGLMQLGFLRVCFDVLEGGRADLARLFSQMNKAVPYALTMLLLFAISFGVVLVLALLGILVAAVLGLSVSDIPGAGASPQAIRDAVAPFLGVLGLAFLVLVGPLTYLLLPLYLVQPELAFNDTPPSPVEVLRRCWGAARGQRLSMLGVGFMTGAVMLLGLVLCCVGFIPGMALAQMLIAGMYLTVRSPWADASESSRG